MKKKKHTNILLLYFYVFLNICPLFAQFDPSVLSENIKVIRESNKAYFEAVQCNAIAWSPDDSYFTVAGRNRILLIDPENFKVLKTLRENTTDIISVSISPDGKYLLSGNKDGTILVWLAETWDNLMTPWNTPRILNCGLVPAISINSVKNQIASGDWDNKINIWSIDNWHKIKSFRNSELSEELLKESIINQSIQSIVRSIDFSPDGKYLATGGNDRTVRIWDTETWENIQSLCEHEHWISSVAFSPVGSYLASSDHDGIVNVWNTNNWGFIEYLDAHDLRCLCVTFSQDGKYLASSGDSGEIFIFNTKSWDLVNELKDGNNSVYSISFSNNCKYLVSKSNQNIIIWSTDTWKALKK